jgi:hypothetical protein
MPSFPLKERLRLSLCRFRIGNKNGVLPESIRTELARWPSVWGFVSELKKDKTGEAEWLPRVQEERDRQVQALGIMGLDIQAVEDGAYTTPAVFFQTAVSQLWGMAETSPVRNQLQPLMESFGFPVRDWWTNAMKSRTEAELHAMLAHIDPTQKEVGSIFAGVGPLGLATVTKAAVETLGTGWVSSHLTQSLCWTEEVALMASHGVSFPPRHVLDWIESMMEDRGAVLPLTGMLDALPPDDWALFETTFGQKLLPILTQTIERHLAEPLDPKIRMRWEKAGEVHSVSWKNLHAAYVQEFQSLFVRLGGNLMLNQPDAHGWTALHRAAVKGNLAEVRFLLDMGANAALPDTEGHTPLALARLSHRIKHLDNPGAPFSQELESVLFQAALATGLPGAQSGPRQTPPRL